MSEPAWTDPLLQAPHEAADKQARVRAMFASIARSYDLNNRLHSFGLDQRWRSRVVKLAKLSPHDRVLDVACGTGDLTLAFARALVRSGNGKLESDQVIGLDYTPEMLELARPKAPGITFIEGDARQLPFADQSFDVLSIAFGIRNVQGPVAAMTEFARVLRPGGRLLILEFSEPQQPMIRRLNRFYTHSIMPRTASWIAGDRSGAYRYLPKSVESFISRDAMLAMMRDAGLIDQRACPMTFGVAVCYVAIKP